MKSVADHIGISASALSQKCSGRIAFSADEIARLADLLGVSTDVLLGREPLEVA
ncbi:MAG: helix-turn-helix transcriptional regulator [Bifidobacterium sp.]|uniref:helix-turn-helix domain-containing protein n=1 Tax=Bifidobacterium sp. TaxID=41200 RepID=UPI00257F3048|nr:helix-turn-helix transcriptional regulator [Bifidobacterium sp.]MBS5401312.1 helix-turn-helix transcriptional regulator [Bifidobacterium sp.]